MATPFEALEHFFAQLDAAIERFEEALPCFRCPVHCCECCQQMPPFLMSNVEYALICRWVQGHFSPAEQEAVLLRARMQARDYEFGQVTKAEEDPSLRESLPRRLCPFLSGGKCSIYPVRPLACRLFGRTLITQGPDAGRFNGCDILAEQAGLSPGRTVRMHSADSLRQQLLNLCLAVRDQGGVVAFHTLAKFLDELGFEWSEETLRRGFTGAVFQPGVRVEHLL
jgi:Fe-S-cluster containining protein